MDEVIRDRSGHIICRKVTLNEDNIVYLTSGGSTLARVVHGITYDKNNRMVGRGDLGMMVVGQETN